MIRDQFLLSDCHDEIIVDNFAGGGGASVGIELALGRSPDHAINHDQHALGMHRINHPQTVHHCEDVFDIDPAALMKSGQRGSRRIGFAWFSPDCKHFSKAKGGKPLSKKIRGLVLVMFRYAAIQARVMVMENVEEIATWGPLLRNGQPDPKQRGRTWRAFLDALSTGLRADHPDIPMMLAVLNQKPKSRHPSPPPPVTREQLVRGFGYKFEINHLRGAKYGAPTIRKRLFLIARCDDQPIVWPEPSHYDPKAKPSTLDPRPSTRRLRPQRIIAECLDFSLPCPSIFLTRKQAVKSRCKRPLAKPTLHRVATGIGRYVLNTTEPFLVNLTHQGGERIESISEPSRTITGAKRGEKALVDTTLVSNSGPTQVAPVITEHANATHQRNFPANEPGRTQCAEVKGGHFALISPVLAHVAHGERDKNGKKRGRGAKPVTEPFPSILASNDTAVIAAHLSPICPLSPIAPPQVALAAASIVKLRGEAKSHAPGHPVTEPGHTSSAGGNHHGVVSAELAALDPRPSALVTSASAVYLAQHNGGFNDTTGHPVAKPMSSVCSKGSQQQVVAAQLSPLSPSRPINSPLSTINSACAVAYYGSEADGQGMHEPARTVTAKARLGLAVTQLVEKYPGLTTAQIIGAHRVAKFLRRHGVTFEGDFATVTAKDGTQYIIVDIGMRMLTPRELFRAQGFHEGYLIHEAWLIHPKTGKITVIKLTKEQQIRMCGNSVCPPVAEAITRANVPELAMYKPGEHQRLKRELALV
jgi:DNA (cytosine-5)-methyltransferase 1